MKTILSGIKAWTRRKIKESTANWCQNDPSAPDYVKNRTHWEEESIETVFPSTTFSFDKVLYTSQYSTGWNKYALPLLVVGKTYTVTFDGIEYSCTCEERDESDEQCLCLGNAGGHHSGDYYDGGEPFFIAYNPYRGNERLKCYGPVGGEHTFSIVEENVIVHKIPSQYIYDLVIKGVYDNNTYIFKSAPAGTYEMIRNRLKNKEPITGVFQMEYHNTNGSIEYGSYVMYECEWLSNEERIYLDSYDYSVYLYPDESIVY